MNKKKNVLVFALIAIGIVLFGVIAFVVIKSTASVSAIVPNQTIKAGTQIDETMLDTVQIPANTPSGFITDKSSLVGQKLKTEVSKDQLLYISNIVSATDYKEGDLVPKDYVITSIQLPPDRAVGGILTQGETVDVLGIPNDTYSSASKEDMENYLGEMAKDSYGSDGERIYWVLSNVKILDIVLIEDDGTTNEEGENVSKSANGEAYYIVALSYDDYKKIRLSEEYLDIWMSVTPSYNDENGPLLDQMKEDTIKQLQDAQAQSKIKEEKKKEETTEPSTTNE